MIYILIALVFGVFVGGQLITANVVWCLFEERAGKKPPVQRGR